MSPCWRLCLRWLLFYVFCVYFDAWDIWGDTKCNKIKNSVWESQEEDRNDKSGEIEDVGSFRIIQGPAVKYRHQAEVTNQTGVSFRAVVLR